MTRQHSRDDFVSVIGHLETSENITDDDRKLIGKLKDFSKEAHGKHQGYLCVACCFELNSLVKFLPDYPRSTSLSGSALCRDVMEHVVDFDLLILLTGIVLERWSETGFEEHLLGDRIMQQMDCDIKAKERFRYPKLYRTGSARSLAAAVVIDDRYWTDDWPAKRPSKLWR